MNCLEDSIMEYQSDQDCYNITMFIAERYLGDQPGME